ncbi:hypothetical protein HDU67_006443 [Dinochytrium kinnereticum]|nr:hypothetical protein HDU67_006443 [Dinochytrium kinnereticum]
MDALVPTKSPSEVLNGGLREPVEEEMAEAHKKNSSFIYSTGPALDHPTSGNKQFLVSLIPGVNLPLYALGYYFLTLVFSGVLHEFGHGLAAAWYVLK